jgi:hypothetical protein
MMFHSAICLLTPSLWLISVCSIADYSHLSHRYLTMPRCCTRQRGIDAFNELKLFPEHRVGQGPATASLAKSVGMCGLRTISSDPGLLATKPATGLMEITTQTAGSRFTCGWAARVQAGTSCTLRLPMTKSPWDGAERVLVFGATSRYGLRSKGPR